MTLPNSAIDHRPDDAMVARIDAALARALAEQRLVGAVVRVARDGVIVAQRAFGLADREAGVPMRDDTDFRLASLTKAIVAVVVLELVDRGAIALDDPVTRWLPEFTPRFDGQPVPITVRQLLTHTSGLSYGFLEPRDGPYHTAHVSDGLDQPGLTLDENLRRLATVPLRSRPGSEFRYSVSYDVLGAIVERAAGESLAERVARVVTGPLGLSSIAFHAPADRALATPYVDGTPAPVRMFDGIYVPFAGAGTTFAPSRARDPRSYPSGGAGLVGNASDYVTFLEALRTRALPLSARWVDEMCRDQIAPLRYVSPMLGDGWDFGYGVAVLRDPAAARSPMGVGSVRWNGAYGHFWWIDPGARLSAVLLTNTTFEGMAGRIRVELERAVYGA